MAHGAHALGSIRPDSTTTGLRATANRPDPAQHFAVDGLQFQALAANAGSVYICTQETPDLDKDVLAEIGPPLNGMTQWSIGHPSQRAGFNAADFWIIPAIPGEGVRVSVIT